MSASLDTPDRDEATPQRPAFYALAHGGWRDYVTLLHPPYTAWHLAYVIIGAALAPTLHLDRLAATVLAFFLAVGIGAHALDELHDRPLRTAIPSWTLTVLAAVSIAAAVAIGAVGAVRDSSWLWLFIAAGTFVATAYNLELFHGRFHNDAWFAIAWGGFPCLVGYFAMTDTLSVTAVGIATFACSYSAAQRHLSRRVRTIRRATTNVTGAIAYRDGHQDEVTSDMLTRPLEAALQAQCSAIILLAATLVIYRLT